MKPDSFNPPEFDGRRQETIRAETFLIQERQIRAAIEKLFRKVIAALPDADIREITVTQALILLLLIRSGKASLQELAGRMEVSAPTASQLVESLHRRGLLHRAHGQNDRRRICIQIETEAVEKVARLEAAMTHKLSEVANQIGPDHFWNCHKTVLMSVRNGHT